MGQRGTHDGEVDDDGNKGRSDAQEDKWAA